MDFLKKFKPKKNKLSEELITQAVDLEFEDAIEERHDQDGDVLSYKVEYLGCLPVDHWDESKAEEALKCLKNERELSKKKIQKGVILISPNFFILTDMKRKELIKVPILRISSCSMDPFNRNVFFFICGDKNRRKFYHAFSCEKWKNAYNAALTIAHMFSLSHENYLREQQNKKFCGYGNAEVNKGKENEEKNQINSLDLMDFSVDTGRSIMKNTNASENWVSFED